MKKKFVKKWGGGEVVKQNLIGATNIGEINGNKLEKSNFSDTFLIF